MSKQPNVLQRFGDRLREARKARGLSQEAFADLCGLGRTYVSGIERGNSNVSLQNIALIAKALDLTVSELAKGI